MQAVCGAPIGAYHSIQIPVLIAVTGAEMLPTPAQTRLFMLVTSWIDETSKKPTHVYRWMRRISNQPFEISDDNRFLFSRGIQLFSDVNKLYLATKPIRCIELVVSLYPNLVIFPIQN